MFPSCILTHRGATGGPGKFAILGLPPQTPPDLRGKRGNQWGGGQPQDGQFPRASSGPLVGERTNEKVPYVLKAVALRNAEDLAKKIHRQHVIRKAQKAEDRRKNRQRARAAR